MKFKMKYASEKESDRQELVKLIYIVAIVFAVIGTAVGVSLAAFHYQSALAGFLLGFVVYAVFFTREKYHKFFPEIMFYVSWSCCGFGPVAVLFIGKTDSPYQNLLVMLAIAVATLCALYKRSLKKKAAPISE